VPLAQEKRVEALRRLWDRAEPSPGRLFRHCFYARIAAGEPGVWERCGTEEQRAAAVKDPSKQPQGSRPANVIVAQWDAALAAAFDGLKFNHVRGSRNNASNPNGIWTDELKTKTVV
jgi:hypothetical protein